MKKILLAATAAFLVFSAAGQSSRPIFGRIRIEATKSGKTRFGPPELVVWAGEQLHWYNDTAVPHEPGILRADGTFVAFLEAPVLPHTTSSVFSPAPRLDNEKKLAPYSLPYICGLHPDEHGVIQIIPTP